jgi:hypothetical protein
MKTVNATLVEKKVFNGKTYEMNGIFTDKMTAQEMAIELKKLNYSFRIVPLTPSLKTRFSYHKLFICKN